MKENYPNPCRIFPKQYLSSLDLSEYFDDPTRPLDIDLGCGKGRFLIAHAQKNPERNMLGIDRMLGRMRKLDARLARMGIGNTRLLRLEGTYALEYLVPEHSVDNLFYFFPDPWPKRRHKSKRLFQQETADRICKILKMGGKINIATDHLHYFDDMFELLDQDPRFAVAPAFFPTEDERTDFELIFREYRPIGRCSFARVTGD